MHISFDIEMAGSVRALVSGTGVAAADHSVCLALAPETVARVSDGRNTDLIAALTEQADEITATVNVAGNPARMDSPAKPNVLLDEDMLGFGLGFRH